MLEITEGVVLKKTEIKNLFVITLITTIIYSCTQNSTEKQSTDQQEPTFQSSSNIASNQNLENWEYLYDSEWYIMLKDSINGQRKYIEPACLSSSGSIEFRGTGELKEVIIACGQDAVVYNITSVENNKSSLRIEFSNNGGNGKIEIISTERSEKHPHKQITIRVKNIDDLLLGYYPDNILEINKDESVYIQKEEGTFNFLKKNGLYSKLPCDEEDEY